MQMKSSSKVAHHAGHTQVELGASLQTTGSNINQEESKADLEAGMYMLHFKASMDLRAITANKAWLKTKCERNCLTVRNNM